MASVVIKFYYSWTYLIWKVLYSSGFLAVFRLSPAEIEVAQDDFLVAG